MAAIFQDGGYKMNVLREKRVDINVQVTLFGSNKHLGSQKFYCYNHHVLMFTKRYDMWGPMVQTCPKSIFQSIRHHKNDLFAVECPSIAFSTERNGIVLRVTQASNLAFILV